MGLYQHPPIKLKSYNMKLSKLILFIDVNWNMLMLNTEVKWKRNFLTSDQKIPKNIGKS